MKNVTLSSKCYIFQSFNSSRKPCTQQTQGFFCLNFTFVGGWVTPPQSRAEQRGSPAAMRDFLSQTTLVIFGQHDGVPAQLIQLNVDFLFLSAWQLNFPLKEPIFLREIVGFPPYNFKGLVE